MSTSPSPRPHLRHRPRLAGALCLVVALAAACGGDDGDGPADPGPTTTTEGGPAPSPPATDPEEEDPVGLAPAPAPADDDGSVEGWLAAHAPRWTGGDLDDPGDWAERATTTSPWGAADAIAWSAPGRAHAAERLAAHAAVDDPPAATLDTWADRLGADGDWTHDAAVADLVAGDGADGDDEWLDEAHERLTGRPVGDLDEPERSAWQERLATEGREAVALALTRSPEARRHVAGVLLAEDDPTDEDLDVAIAALAAVEGDVPRFLARWDALDAPPVPRERTTVSLLGDSLAWQLVGEVPPDLTIAEVDGAWIVPCAVVDRPLVVAEGRRFPRAPQCAEWPQRWADHLAGAGADAVVVTQGPSTLFDLDVDGRRVAHGSAEWWDLQVEAVEQAMAVIRAHAPDAPVLWSDVPCYRWPAGDTAGEEYDPERLATSNRVVAETLAAHPGVEVFAYAEHVCEGPEGTDPVPGLRPDGAHLTAEGAHDWWRRIDALVQAA